MSAALTDKITDVRNAARPNSTTVATTRSPAGTTLACANLVGWPTASKVHFVTYKIDSSSNPVAGSQVDYYGIVSGNNIGSLTVIDGTDAGNAVGDIVEMLPTAAWGQDLADALTQTLNRDGTLKDSIVATAKIAASAVTTPKLSSNILTGWYVVADSWTFSSYDSANKTGIITVPSDATTVYGVGMRVNFTNSGTQYGIITAVSSTTLTIYFGTDYSLTNAAITSPRYSPWKAPLGFPTDPTKWTVTLVSNTSSQTQSSPSGTTWYNPGSLSGSIPIGAWRTFWSAQVILTSAATQTSVSIQASLSTSASSASDSDFTTAQFIQGASGTLSLQIPVHREKTLVVAAATTYYLIVGNQGGTAATIGFAGNNQTTFVKAICAHL